MADKLRRTHPIKITVAEGEQPTAAKLTSIAEQARNGTNLIEYAVGDLWNESGDSFLLDNYPLQIPNLARLIGQNKLLNPALYNISNNFRFYDHVGAKYTDKNEAYLQFKPNTGTITVTTAGRITGTIQSDPANVNATKNTFVDATNGKLVIWRSDGEGFDGSEVVNYIVNPTDWITDTEYLPSIIPDPRQSSFTRCRLSEDGSKYYLHLPPRLGLRTTDLSGFDRPDRYPSDTDVNASENKKTAAGGTVLFAQDPTVSAIAEAHYKYQFPKEIVDALAGLSAGEALPKGLLLLWDHTANTIVRDAVFMKSDKTSPEDEWTLEISSVQAASDFAIVSAASANETEDSYNLNARYSLVCVGASIANTLRFLTNHAWNHDHGNLGDMSSQVPHNNLIGRDPLPNEMGISFFPSQWTDDPHISLLSRVGTGQARDENDNAMLGDLLIAGTTSTNGNYLTTSGTSNKIYFGTTSGPSIYQEDGVLFVSSDSQINGDLTLDTGSDTHISLIVDQADSYINIYEEDSAEYKWSFGYNDDENDFRICAGSAGVDAVESKSIIIEESASAIDFGIGMKSPLGKGLAVAGDCLLDNDSDTLIHFYDNGSFECVLGWDADNSLLVIDNSATPPVSPSVTFNPSNGHITSNGNITLDTGDFLTGTGDFVTTSGNVTATNGDLTASAGNIWASAGTITANKFDTSNTAVEYHFHVVGSVDTNGTYIDLNDPSSNIFYAAISIGNAIYIPIPVPITGVITRAGFKGNFNSGTDDVDVTIIRIDEGTDALPDTSSTVTISNVTNSLNQWEGLLGSGLSRSIVNNAIYYLKIENSTLNELRVWSAAIRIDPTDITAWR